MASSEVRMPSPVAVPNEVVRPPSALISCLVSEVGGTRTTAVPAKATRPIRGPPVWDLTKALVACSAAVIRFGLTSVEHMEPETSRASMIVADDDATGTVACGRAAPIASTARPSVSSATGMRRRQRERPGMAVRTRASEVTRTTERLRDRFQGGGVERGEQVVAVDHDGGARGGADPDGVDVHAGLLGHRGRRVGAGVGAGGPAVVLAVGEQHDGGRGPEADVRRVAVA